MRTVTNPAVLRAARERAGETRETAATAAGVSYSAIQAYELGRSDPSARVLLALAALYDVTVEELCTAEDDAPAGAA
jgi:transcriptional regulator with XRE-family HTH domain